LNPNRASVFLSRPFRVGLPVTKPKPRTEGSKSRVR